MMTTMAALLGAVPIAVGYGAGGEARQSLGVAVVGGLVFSQLVTLYLTPVFFICMDRLQTRLRSEGGLDFLGVAPRIRLRSGHDARDVGILFARLPGRVRAIDLGVGAPFFLELPLFLPGPLFCPLF